ncbi:uncharacterized protein F4807DRAFT_193318 [Annulohypoxylon truncatum]|uniref:uncharacterized protein n=1 Tax=Annulohypoxylon truncatum TaxID=327061 RepID=UPI0020073711|nr:uncharacterized protein F4807DRAFT_193318 [Annulohypoxylon truncatum]KAI1213594.1 hypothetical protein F4807DRAFT_193318 [Annulohypoxylon truncatum]
MANLQLPCEGMSVPGRNRSPLRSSRNSSIRYLELSSAISEENQQKVWSWLDSATNNKQDPNLLGPFPDWIPRKIYSPSLPGDLPQSGGLTDIVDAPVEKPSSFSTGRSRSASPVLRRKSSRLLVTHNKLKRVRFADLPDMYPTPAKTIASLEMEPARGRTATKEPGREPFHARVASQPQLPKPEEFGASQHQYAKKYSNTLGHTRNNSVPAVQQYPQQPGRQPTPERGRKLQKTYEFQSDESDKGLSPVAEATMDNHLPHATTMNDIIARRDTEARDHSRSMSRHKSPKPSSSVGAQARRRPPPLDLNETHRYGVVVRGNAQPVHNPVYSPYPEQGQQGQQHQFVQYRSSSVYMDDTPLPYYDEPSPSPLHVPTTSEMRGRADSILQGYNVWKDSQSGVGTPMGGLERTRSTTAMEHGHPSEMMKAGDRVSLGPSHDGATLAGTPVQERFKEVEAPLFTPLTPYLMHTRMGSKTMIGNKGWLEDTAEQAKKPTAKKKDASFMDTFKKTARKIAAEMTEFRGEKPRTHTARELNISLDPREQSLLYCELEFILSNALSAYINLQLHSGRLNPHVHAKISDAWEQKGRPKVIGFRYDLETQIDMIAAHVGSFRFYGPHQADHDVVKGCLYGMKVNARSMRIHTYCQPDPVIAKHILDAQALMRLLDSPDSVQVPLAEVSQFFKVVLEREKDARKKRLAEKAGAAAGTAGYAPNKGPRPQNQGQDPENLSPPKGKHPGEYRVKNQIGVPEGERDFSGPVLEPKVYDPLRSNPPMGGQR